MGRTQVAHRLSLLYVVTLLALLAGCGSNISVSGIIPQPTPTPKTGFSPTPTPAPTATPSPSPTPTRSRIPSPTPTPSPSPTPSPTPRTASRFIYGTPGFEAPGVQAGIIHADGTITPVAGSPFSEGLGTPSIIEIISDAAGRFIYVLNVEAQAAGELIGSPGLCGFAIDPASGVLTRVPGSPIVFPVRNNNMIVLDDSAHFLFEGNLANTGFDVYSVDQSNGMLAKTSAGSNAPPVGPFAAASADGRFLFSAGNGMVEAFSIDTLNGNLTIVPGMPISNGGSAGPMATTADGEFLYVANQTEGTMMVFTIAGNGALTRVNGSPFAIDIGAQFLTLTPGGKFLFVASFSVTPSGASQTVKGYAVNPSSGTFAPLAGAVVNEGSSVTIDGSGKLAYVSLGLTTPLRLVIFSLDPATGALRQVGAQSNAPFSDDPNDVVAVP